MKLSPWLNRALAFLLLSGCFGQAQTLVEVQLVSAIVADLNIATIKLPASSYRAVGAGADALIAQVPESGAYQNWQVYTATGVVANLQPAFVQEVATSFALSGLFEESRTERQVGNASHEQYIFSDGINQATLYVIRNPSELIWLIGEAK